MALLGVASLGALIATVLATLYSAEARHQKTLLKSAAILESFYSNELAQWNGYERTTRGADVGVVPAANGFYNCNFSNSYEPLLGALNAHFSSEAYDANALPEYAYSLKTTGQFDFIKLLNRRLVPGSLQYAVIDK